MIVYVMLRKISPIYFKISINLKKMIKILGNIQMMNLKILEIIYNKISKNKMVLIKILTLVLKIVI